MAMERKPGVSASRIWLATESDLAEVMEVDRLSFPVPWDYNHFREALKDLFLVFEEEKIVGYLIACRSKIADKAVILRLATHPDYRRRGIASRLLETAIAKLKELKVTEVEIDVDVIKGKTVKLYEKFGFKVIRAVPVNYTLNSGNEPFYMMKLTFNNLS